MPRFPISDEAIERVGDWLDGFVADTGASAEQLDGRDRLKDAEEIAEVVLKAEGFEVEHRGSFFPAKREGIMEHRDTHQRLVSPWRPL